MTAEQWQRFADVGGLEQFIDGARRAQQAINALGAGPPGTAPNRACFFCGKVLMAAGGFIETVRQPDGERRDYCSNRCLCSDLTEDEKR